MKAYLENLLKDEYTKKILIFSSIFGIGLYSLTIFNFLIGDHTVGVLTGRLYPHFFNGRFSTYYINNITQSLYLPILTPLINIFGLILFIALLLRYFLTEKILKKDLFIYFFVLSMPFILSWFYYGGYMYVFFPLVILGFIFAKKNTFVYRALSILCFYLVLGNYQVFINLILIVFIFTIINDFIVNYQKKFVSIFNENIKLYLSIFINISIGVIFYGIRYLIMKSNGQIVDSYMTRTNSLDVIFSKIPEVFMISFKLLIVPQPFINWFYKFIFFIIIILFLVFVVFNKFKKLNLINSLFILFLLCFAIFVMNISDLISSHSMATEPRAMVFGYLGFLSLILILSLKHFDNNIKKVFICLVCILIYFNIINSLFIQRNWKLNNEIEKMQINRIITRIENLEEFNYKNSYQLHQIGSFSAASPKHISSYYSYSKYDRKFTKLLSILGFNDLDRFKKAHPFEHLRINAGWMAARIFYFFEPNLQLTNFNLESLNTNVYTEYKNVIYNAKPWPAKESVQLIDNNIILLILDAESLTQEQNKIQGN